MNRRVEKRFFRPDVQRDVDDEIRYHLEMRQRELVDRGVPERDARDVVAQRFGNVAAIARECRAIDEAWYREQRRASMFMDLQQDVAYAWRVLRKSPMFTLVAVLTLALGIGATTAIFSLANWALLRPVPGVSASDDVRFVWFGRRSSPTSFSPSRISYPNWNDMVPKLTTMSLGAFQSGSASVAAANQAARPAPGLVFVTAEYFEVLGVRTVAGRLFTRAEDNPAGGAHVAVLSEGFARTLFGSAAGAVGEPLMVNGLPFTVIGVTGGGFVGTDRIGGLSIWLPGATQPAVNHAATMRSDNRASGGFYAFVARPRPGATWAQVEAELQSMLAWLTTQYPEDNKRLAQRTFHVVGPLGSDPLGRQRTVRMVLLMLGASALVLLIACSNVASLMLMRGIGRSGEVAVRKALGATRLRLVRQHLTEGLLLWVAGGSMALLLVWVLLQSVKGETLLGLRGPGATVPIDWRVVAFALLLSLAVGLVFSVVPAFRAARAEPAPLLREGGTSATPRHLRVGTALAVVQLSLSLTLVVGALLLAATVRQLAAVKLGFEPAGVYTFMVRPGSVGYTSAQAAVYRDEFARRLALLPGVEHVATAIRAPFVGSTLTTIVRRDGTKDVLEPKAIEVISAGLFETLRIPVLHGRVFTDDDLGRGGAARPVVVVSEGFARELFGAVNVVGRTIEFNTMGRVGTRYEIIGVVGDIRYDSLVEEPEPMVYEPAAQDGLVRAEATFLVRARAGTDVADAAAQTAAALNPSLPVMLPRSLTEAVVRARAEWDVLALLMLSLAAIAAVLAGVGLYGVIAFGVASRRREFGIRLALGAAPIRVMTLVLRRTAVIAALALLLGAGGAVALARLLSSRLFGVTPFDPVVWGLAAVSLVTLAGIASWIPARRAVSVDVTTSLRAL